MSLVSENVIPGNHGKLFETNAKGNHDLNSIKDKLTSLDGIKDVIINAEVFPKEFTVYTSELVTIKDVESVVKSLGFHAIPKTLFTL